MLPPFNSERVIEQVIREEWGRLLAALIPRCGDFQLAEDSLQDAVMAALDRWSHVGIPEKPSAWLMAVAGRKAIDRLRRDQNFRSKTSELSYLLDLENEPIEETQLEIIPDKRLEMIYTCCHPALEEKTRVALTLRTLGGMTTEEIAAAFLDKPNAMGQRLSRAKKKIKLAGIPFEIPKEHALPERTASVLSVIYLVFNEGYGTSHISKTDLSNEAIRLGRILHSLLPDDTEVAGLLALMLLHDSRRLARIDESGAMVPLSEQNRARWDKSRLKEGYVLIEKTFEKREIGPYQIQAAISALHGSVETWEATDWAQICELYGVLYQLQPTPIVHLNQAVAQSFAGRTESGLNMLLDIGKSGELDGYHPYFAALGELNERAENLIAAKTAYEKAIALLPDGPERNFLKKKLKKVPIQ